MGCRLTSARVGLVCGLWMPSVSAKAILVVRFARLRGFVWQRIPSRAMHRPPSSVRLRGACLLPNWVGVRRCQPEAYLLFEFPFVGAWPARKRAGTSDSVQIKKGVRDETPPADLGALCGSFPFASTFGLLGRMPTPERHGTLYEGWRRSNTEPAQCSFSTAPKKGAFRPWLIRGVVSLQPEALPSGHQPGVEGHRRAHGRDGRLRPRCRNSNTKNRVAAAHARTHACTHARALI